MNTVTVKILIFLLMTFGLITVSYQVYLRFHQKYETETAEASGSATMETFYGIFVRDESVIKYSGGGALSYALSDGSKVASDSVVAYVYGSEDDIINNGRIEKLKKEIELLESAQSPGTTETANPDKMSKLIEENYQNISTHLAKKDLSELSSERDSFLSVMNIYRITIGEEANFNDRIDALYKELNILEGRKKSPQRNIKSDGTGYFVSVTDGYEDELNTENIESITPAQIKEIISNEISGEKKKDKNAVGKLIDGYDWKMLGIIDNSENTYCAGDTVKLKFASTSDTVWATIDKITETDDPNESVVEIFCEEMTFNLVKNRVERVEMILHDYEGIKVPREALRFDKDNNKGVYTLLGQRVMFKKLDIIFECEDYLLSGLTADTEYLNIYDEIIISGVDTAEYFAVEEEMAEDNGKNDEPKEEIPIYSGDETYEGNIRGDENDSEDNEDNNEENDTENNAETESSDENVSAQ